MGAQADAARCGAAAMPAIAQHSRAADTPAILCCRMQSPGGLTEEGARFSGERCTSSTASESDTRPPPHQPRSVGAMRP